MDEKSEDRGFQPIGNLAAKIAGSLPNAASTRPSSETPSEIIGFPGRALAGPSSTGALPSAIGAAKSAIAEALAAGDPAATDRVLEASLTQCVTFSAIRPATDDPYTTFSLRGYRIEGSDRPLARQLIEEAMRPAVRQDLAKELTRVRALTASRAAAEDDTRVIFAVYLDALSEYPADATMAALRRWPHEHKFWPAMSELAEAIWSVCEFRRMIADAADGREP
jgi:hypothetical protein